MMKSSAEMDRVLDRHKSKTGVYDWVAKVPFGVFAVGGMGAIFLMKNAGISPIWTAAFAILMIIGYAVLVKAVVHLRIRDDQVGDNCYYLGFLYTLMSLAIALYQFTMTSSTSQAVTDIVANFGIALASTIFGILARVVINQNRRDAIEVEHDARLMMSQALTELSLGLNAVVISLRDFSEQTKQVISDSMRDNMERAEEAIAVSSERISQASLDVLARIDSSFESFNENTKRLNSVAAQTVSALENLSRRLESVESPGDIITKRLEAVVETLDTVGRVLRDRLEADVTSLDECAERVKAIEESLSRSAEDFEVSGKGVAAAGEGSRKAAEAAEAAVSALQSLSREMKDVLTAQRDAAGKTIAAQEEVTRNLSEGHRKLAQEIEESYRSLAGVLRSHNEEMAKEVERARRMSAETGGALADLATTLTERMRENRNARMSDSRG